MDAIQLLTKLGIQHEQERMVASRSENVVLCLDEACQLAKTLDGSKEAYEQVGKKERDTKSAADYRGNLQGTRTRCVLQGASLQTQRAPRVAGHQANDRNREAQQQSRYLSSDPSAHRVRQDHPDGHERACETLLRLEGCARQASHSQMGGGGSSLPSMDECTPPRSPQRGPSSGRDQGRGGQSDHVQSSSRCSRSSLRRLFTSREEVRPSSEGTQGTQDQVRGVASLGSDEIQYQ